MSFGKSWKSKTSRSPERSREWTASSAFFSTLAGTVDILKFEPQEFIAQRDKVVVLGESLFRTKAGGKEFGNKWAHVTTVANGKLKHFQDYGDTAAAEKAFKK
jgi:uncharacterized protein